MSKGGAVEILQLCSAPAALELQWFCCISLSSAWLQGLPEIIHSSTHRGSWECTRVGHHSCEMRVVNRHMEPNSWVRMALGMSFPPRRHLRLCVPYRNPKFHPGPVLALGGSCWWCAAVTAPRFHSQRGVCAVPLQGRIQAAWGSLATVEVVQSPEFSALCPQTSCF